MKLFRMTIGKKLAFGFGTVLIVVFVSGLISYLQLKKVHKETKIMVNEYIPEIHYAQSLLKQIDIALLNIQSYVTTEETKYLSAGRVALIDSGSALEQLRDLAASDARHASLVTVEQQAREALEGYTQLMDDTTKNVTSTYVLRQKMNQAANNALDKMSFFIEEQLDSITRDTKKFRTRTAVAKDFYEGWQYISDEVKQAVALQSPQQLAAAAQILNDNIPELVTRYTNTLAGSDQLDQINTMQRRSDAYVTAIQTYADAFSTGPVNIPELDDSLEAADSAFLQGAISFMNQQNSILLSLISQRKRKIEWATQIRALMSQSHLTVLNAQVLNQFNDIKKTDAAFVKIKELFSSLLMVTKEPHNIEAIESVKESSIQYQEALRKYATVWQETTQLAERRNTAGDTLKQAALDTADAGEQGIRSITDTIVNIVQHNSKVSIFSLIATIFIGIAASLLITRGITRGIRQLQRVAEQVKNGDLDVEITANSSDEVGELAHAFQDVVSTLQLIIRRFQELAAASEKGQLSFRPDAAELQGGYLEMVQIVNRMLDNISDPIKETLQVMKCLSVNDLTRSMPKIYKGDFKEMSIAVNQVLLQETHIQDCMVNISEGSLDELPALKAKGKYSENDRLMPSLIHMMEAIQALVADANALAEAGAEGRLSDRADEARHAGAYREVIAGVNTMMDIITGRLKKAGNVLNQIAHGEQLKPMTEELKGDYNINKQNVNTCVSVLEGLQNEVSKLVQAGIEGRLNERADADAYEGIWHDIVQGMNDIMEAVVTPLNEASDVLSAAAENDLTQKMQGNYQGQLAELKNNINSMTAKLSAALTNVRDAVDQVNDGARQISGASQSLSQGATVQASSLEEITSSMSQVASQTKTNAENATQAKQLSENARSAAGKGVGHMEDMGLAMADIDSTSKEIAKFIKTIDGIAFQTNLLALNAAVEAARAGQHGKGFAVVADEVRNLASRSAKAAQETATLIDSSSSKVAHGLKVAQTTSAAFEGILDAITKTTDLIGEIAAASTEQAQGVTQINIGLQQVDEVTQQNTANAEETASAAQELSGQATLLQTQVSAFKLAEDPNRHSRALPDPSAGESLLAAPRSRPIKNDGWGSSTGIARDTDTIDLEQLDDEQDNA